MAINRLDQTRCRDCGQPLTDRTSRLFRLGPDCRTGRTDQELADALRLTMEESQPGYIPPQRPPTAQARANHAAVAAIVDQATAPTLCVHDGIVGKCPDCVYEAKYPAARIVREIRALTFQERRAERIRVLTVRYGVLR